MPTTTNYGWTTPADTDLVKDGASAIRTLGNSIDTTTKALNPSTTLGDIEYRSSTANTNTRLAIGTTGQILTVSGGVPVWATPTAAGANFTLLNAGGTNLTGAGTITVSGISNANKIMILVERAGSASASIEMLVRFNSDTAANYYFLGAMLNPSSTYSANAFEEMYSGGPGFSTSIKLGQMSNNNSSRVSGYLLLDGCNSTGVKTFNSIGAGGAGGGSSQTHYYLGGYYNSSSTISSISILTSSTNFTAGKVFVYTSA